MRHARALGLTLMAACALSGPAVTSAMAAPEFLHSSKEVTNKSVKLMGKSVKLYLAGGEVRYVVTCQSAISAGGQLNGTTLVKNVQVKYQGCRAKEAEEFQECPVKSVSPAGGKEEVITKTLKGELGEVATSEAASKRGLKLEPVSGSVYMTLTASVECFPFETIEAKGSLIGELTSVKEAVSTAHDIYTAVGEKTQQIKKFKGESGLHMLEFFELPMAIQGEQKVEFGEKVEIT